MKNVIRFICVLFIFGVVLSSIGVFAYYSAMGVLHFLPFLTAFVIAFISIGLGVFWLAEILTWLDANFEYGQDDRINV